MVTLFAQIAILPAIIPITSTLFAQITAPSAIPPAFQHIPQITITPQAEARIHDPITKAITVPGEDIRRKATN
jgi:hypothetical protein